MELSQKQCDLLHDATIQEVWIGLNNQLNFS